MDIINMYNKKFNDDYPDVSKPIICNGLKSIKPFNDEHNKKPLPKIDEEEEPEKHPVFDKGLDGDVDENIL